MRSEKGVYCLFHGTTGTGKEELYIIAYSTGIDITMVDTSETESMWFGEKSLIIQPL